MITQERLKRLLSGFLAFVMVLSMDSGALAYAYQDYLYRETNDPSDVSISASLSGSESADVSMGYNADLEVSEVVTKTGDGYVDVTYTVNTGNQSTDGLGILLELPVFVRNEGGGV